MTDIQLSQLVQDCINGIQEPTKALRTVRRIKEGNKFATRCFKQIEILVNLDSQTPRMRANPVYISQWVEATDSFNYSSNRLDNQKRDYKHSVDHY